MRHPDENPKVKCSVLNDNGHQCRRKAARQVRVFTDQGITSRVLYWLQVPVCAIHHAADFLAGGDDGKKLLKIYKL